MESNNKKQKTHIIPFGIGIASASMSYVVTTQLMYCLTNSYAMSATTVGFILLISRVFDGVTDIIAGFIIDKTNTRFGKARPFDLFTIPLWITLVMCFNVPAFHEFGKILWVFLTYNLCQSVCYTFVTVSQTVRVKRSFTEDIRAKALAVGGMISAVFSTTVSIFCPVLIEMFEGKPNGWIIIIGFFAVPGIIMCLIQFFLVPEILEEEKEMKQQVSVIESIKALFSNKYIFIVAIGIIMISMVNTVLGTVGVFYFKNIVGNLSALSLVSMLSLVGYILLALMPVMTKRLGNRNTMLTAFFLIVSANILKYCFKINIIGLAICACISGVGVTIAQCMRDILVIDCMKYGQWKSKNNYEGVYAAIKGFSDKIALGLGSLLTGIVLDIGGFDETAAVQSESALKAIQFSYAGLPVILGAIGIVAMLCYGLDKKLKEIQVEEV